MMDPGNNVNKLTVYELQILADIETAKNAGEPGKYSRWLTLTGLLDLSLKLE